MPNDATPNVPSDRRSPSFEWLAPLVLLVLGLVLRLGLAWQDHRVLLAECVWSDDAYLSLSAARNLAAGRGMTVDGTNITNGFQPLYVFLMVPVYWLVPTADPVLPVRIAGTLLAVAGTAAAGLWYLIARRLFSRTAALCVLFFFAASSYFVVTDVNGLETALYGLTLSGMLYYYLTRFAGLPRAGAVPHGSAPDGPGASACVVLGVLAGLTVLARVDAGIVLVCVAGHFLWVRRRALGAALRPAAVGAGAALVTLAPWLIANVVLCRTISPDSGSAVRFIAIQNGWRNVGNLIGYVGPERFHEDAIPWQYPVNNLLRIAAQIVSYLPLTAHTQGLRPRYVADRADHLPVAELVAKSPWLALGVIMVIVAAVLVGPLVWTVRARRSPPTPGTQHSALSAWVCRWRAVLFLRFAVVGWVVAYAFYVLCPWYTHRYLYPALALLTLGSGIVPELFLAAVPAGARWLRRGVLGAAAVAYGFLFVTQAGHYYARGEEAAQFDAYTPVLPWVRSHVPRDSVIGCFQSGVLSYFLPQRCVNLDGVVNAAARRASQERRLWDYLRREGVDYIVDWPICIERNLKLYAGVEPVPLTMVYDEYTMKVYRVGEGP